MRALVGRLALLVLPLFLIAAVSGCGGGGSGETNAVGDREGSTTAAPSADPSREEGLLSGLRGGGHVIHFRHTATKCFMCFASACSQPANGSRRTSSRARPTRLG
jgi:hypothetical protein